MDPTKYVKSVSRAHSAVVLGVYCHLVDISCITTVIRPKPIFKKIVLLT